MFLALFEHCVDDSKVPDVPGRPEATVRCVEGSLVLHIEKNTQINRALPGELVRTNQKEIVRT